MEKNKNLEELRKELEKAKREKFQAEHQLQRKKNQLSYRESYSRKERSHRLIVCGAIFEKYFPVIKDLSEKELSRLFIMDEHEMETHRFQVLGYDIEVKDALIAEALQTLTEKKRNVVLLSYFMDMSDADIAREMNLVRSTINEHRRRSLELMRKNMEESANEKK